MKIFDRFLKELDKHLRKSQNDWDLMNVIVLIYFVLNIDDIVIELIQFLSYF